MNTIFVQIASYRDMELIPTIEDALEQAHFPENVSFGVCWQYETEEELDYIAPLKNLKNCRLTAVRASKSRGLGWARSEVQKLWQGEKYTLQTDSHMRFIENWDSVLIEMLKQCPSEKPLLSAYPAGYEPPRKILNNNVTGIEFGNFEDSGIINHKCSGEDLSQYSCPQLGAFVAGGFIFASASIIREVPSDPHIYFNGEEFLISVKAWTRGWDIYHPHQVVCWHYYNSNNGEARPLHWQDREEWVSLNQLSEQRFRQILGIEPSKTDFGIYGLGKERSLIEYVYFNLKNALSWEQVQSDEVSKSA
jgi:hypothetical protein